jgi:dihydrofolate reductase
VSLAPQRTWTGLVFIATSVDGYIAGPDGGLDWLTEPPAEPRHATAQHGDDAPPGYDEFTAGVSHLVMGRGTYEKVLTFDPWPYGRFRVLVLSTTLPNDIDERISVVTSVAEACSLLAMEEATAVYVDGGQVVSRFLAEGLIDELTISRAPVLLGRGLPLFHALPREVRLVHEGTSTTDSGMTSTRYRVVR